MSSPLKNALRSLGKCGWGWVEHAGTSSLCGFQTFQAPSLPAVERPGMCSNPCGLWSLARAGPDPPGISGVVQQPPGLGGEETSRKCETCHCKPPSEQRSARSWKDTVVPLSLLVRIHHVSKMCNRGCPNASITVPAEREKWCIAYSFSLFFFKWTPSPRLVFYFFKVKAEESCGTQTVKAKECWSWKERQIFGRPALEVLGNAPAYLSAPVCGGTKASPGQQPSQEMSIKDLSKMFGMLIRGKISVSLQGRW